MEGPAGTKTANPLARQDQPRAMKKPARRAQVGAASASPSVGVSGYAGCPVPDQRLGLEQLHQLMQADRETAVATAARAEGKHTEAFPYQYQIDDKFHSVQQPRRKTKRTSQWWAASQLGRECERGSWRAAVRSPILRFHNVSNRSGGQRRVGWCTPCLSCCLIGRGAS